MIVAVDTNVLVDILNKDERYFEFSRKLLGRALAKGNLVINEIVYAELVGLFEHKEELNKFLNDFDITLTPSNKQVLLEAGRAWSTYTANRGKQIQCASCGEKFILKCENCSSIITSRQHIISDFLIGGHAKVLADSLLTRDRGYYRNYFEQLPLFG